MKVIVEFCDSTHGKNDAYEITLFMHDKVIAFGKTWLDTVDVTPGTYALVDVETLDEVKVAIRALRETFKLAQEPNWDGHIKQCEKLLAKLPEVG